MMKLSVVHLIALGSGLRAALALVASGSFPVGRAPQNDSYAVRGLRPLHPPVFTVFFLYFMGLSCVGFSEPLTFVYGPNFVDLNGDSEPDLVVRTRWENGNAHSFDTYRLALRVHDEIAGDTYQEIPVGEEMGSAFSTAEGADCATKDDRSFHAAVVFSLDTHHLLRAKVYERLWEENADAYPVRVTEYRLVDARGTALPTYAPIFMKKGTTKTFPRKACDVREVLPAGAF